MGISFFTVLFRICFSKHGTAHPDRVRAAAIKRDWPLVNQAGRAPHADHSTPIGALEQLSQYASVLRRVPKRPKKLYHSIQQSLGLSKRSGLCGEPKTTANGSQTGGASCATCMAERDQQSLVPDCRPLGERTRTSSRRPTHGSRELLQKTSGDRPEPL